jgi:hypothetical protein
LTSKNEGYFALELSELIKGNCLVRGGINLGDFISWYDAIPIEVQSALLEPHFDCNAIRKRSVSIKRV